MRPPRLPIMSRRSSPDLPMQVDGARPQDVFRAQMNRLTPAARKYARGEVGNAAKDVLQEAFWQLWRVAYADGAEVPANDTDKLFYRILRRRCADERRDFARRSALADQQVLDISSYLEASTNSAKVAEGSLMRERVDYVIAALPEKKRTAFLMHEQGHNAHEIAAAMGIGYETARWHVAEAQERIRKQLTKDGYELPAPRRRGHAGVEE